MSIADNTLPCYSGTIFISYARSDDEKPPFDEVTQGWVTFFWGQLRWELTNAGLHQAKLWLDRYEIEPAEEFTEKIESALREARLIVPVLSTNWIQRPYCREELERFVALNGGNRDGIVLVKKHEPPQIPDLLRNREGYSFYGQEPTGQVREFYWRGLKDEKAYYETLKRVARWIVEQLLGASKQSETPARDNGRTVFLAAPADELRDAWQRLANDLQGAGFRVVPPDGRLPDTRTRAAEAITQALASAELSVHLIGESEGGKPDEGEETFLRLQLRLAREEAAARPGLQRVLWAPKWVAERQQAKRDPFEVVARFGPVQAGEHVYAEAVTDLSQWLRQKLDPPSTEPPPGGRVALLVVAADDVDAELVSTLASRLQSEQTSVHPWFPGDPAPAGSPIMLLLWREAKREAVDAVIAELGSSASRVIILRMPGGDTRAKARYFREGAGIEPLDQLPPNASAARAWLAGLELLPQTTGRHG